MSPVPSPFTGVTDITARLGAGADRISFSSVTVTGDVAVFHGDGDGFTGVFDSDIGGDLRVGAGSGDDILSSVAVGITGEFKAVLGDAPTKWTST